MLFDSYVSLPDLYNFQFVNDKSVEVACSFPSKHILYTHMLCLRCRYKSKSLSEFGNHLQKLAFSGGNEFGCSLGAINDYTKGCHTSETFGCHHANAPYMCFCIFYTLSFIFFLNRLFHGIDCLVLVYRSFEIDVSLYRAI